MPFLGGGRRAKGPRPTLEEVLQGIATIQGTQTPSCDEATPIMTDLLANIDELSIGLCVIFGFHCLDSYMDSSNSQILILIHDQEHQQLFPKENTEEYFCLMRQLSLGPVLGE